MQKANCFSFVAAIGNIGNAAKTTMQDKRLEEFSVKYGKSISSVKTFAGVHASKSFTVESAHKAFAGLKHKK